MRNPKFQIFNKGNKKFYYRLKGGNGKIMLQSGAFDNKNACRQGVNAVKRSSGNRKNFEIKETRGGEYFFNILSGSKQVIGSSDRYNSYDSCSRAVKAVMGYSKANIEDLTI